jgi:phosphoesterase RecJ-like protein
VYFTTFSNSWAQQIAALERKPLAVLSHVRPDGDCIGSMVALVRALRALGQDAIGVNANATPRNLQSFVGDTPLAMTASPEIFCDRTLITVDCADIARIGRALSPHCGPVYWNIDHHISNTRYAEHNWIDGESCATAEILAGVFFDLDLPIDACTAQALYVGIATDTGQFRFPSTTDRTFDLAHRLCQAGANPGAAASDLYDNERFGRIRLLQHFLASLKMEMDGLVCIGTLEQGCYAETGTCIEDAEGLVDYARSIEGVAIGVLIEARDGAIKCSLRAKDAYYRVDRIAQCFGGGGHACAAGLNVDDSSITDFYPLLLSAIQQHCQSLPPKQPNQ